jgi:hypothetical protein
MSNMAATVTILSLKRKPSKFLQDIPVRSPEQIFNPKDNEYRKIFYDYLNSWLPWEINYV